MKRHFVIAMFVLVSAVCTLHAESPNEFFFKKNDRIVFLGDSIYRKYQYSTDLELYLTTRFPQWNLTFLNAGIGGDTATGGSTRFASHVLAEKPTAVTIDFGMNDAGYGGFNPAGQATFLKNTGQMLDAAREAGVRVALISPNAVDRRVNARFKRYLETQQQFYAPLKELAVKHELPFVDQYAVTRAVLEKLETAKANVKPFPDGVHTSSAGGLLMAHTILVGLHAPGLVSDVSIDAASNKVEKKACTVENLQSSATSVSFDRLDEALPLPVQPDWLVILPYVDQLRDLNWYGLKVTGLASGKYAVHIDGKEIGTYSTEQLAEGVNLGNLTSGPIFDQGRKVFTAINDKNSLVHQRFRGIVMFQAPDWLADVAAERRSAELNKRAKQIADRQAEIYRQVQPAAHHFEVKQQN